jgi:hypothetical protein
LYNEDIVTATGEIHHEIDNVRQNYFYKDITLNAYTIRVIGLYQFEWDVPRSNTGAATYYENTKGKNYVLYSQAQIDWLCEVLSNSYPSDGIDGVIILSHYNLSRSKFIDSVINQPNARDTVVTEDINEFNNNSTFFYKLIHAWINGSSGTAFTLSQTTSDNEAHNVSVTPTFSPSSREKGKFIANICGHRHAGGMLWMVDDDGNIQDGSSGREKLPVVMAPTSTSRDQQNSGWWARVDSVKDYTKLQDCLNVIVYDNDADKLKVIRVGSNITAELNEIKSFVF